MPLFGTRGAASVTGFGGLAKLGYLLRNSLRFRGANNAYLSRTPSVTGNRKVWTWSGWVKRGQLDSGASDRVLFGSPSQSGNDGIAAIYFESDQLHTYYDSSGASPYGPVGPRLYRDPAAWYHIVWAVDAANTIHYVYVNNTLVSTDSAYYPPNYEYSMNRSGGYTHTMGTEAWGATNYFDGYMAEVNFVDGQALTPSSFGKTDPATGQWIPIKYSGTYGTNGFYLKFDDSSAVGKDSSGNGNNWSTSGHSVTPGVTYDLMTDVPTNTSETTANYCVINGTTSQPTGWGAATTFSNANLTGYMPDSGTDAPAYGTIALPRSGKWYWEVIITNSTVPGAVGVSESSMARPDTTGPICRMLYSGGGTGVSYASNGFTNSGSYTFFGNATLGIACDMDNGAIYFAVNGTYVNSGVPTSGASKTGAIFTDLLSASPGGGSWLPMSYGYLGHVHNHNYGQRPFAYSAPSGYKTLNTFNLP